MLRVPRAHVTCAEGEFSITRLGFYRKNRFNLPMQSYRTMVGRSRCYQEDWEFVDIIVKFLFQVDQKSLPVPMPRWPWLLSSLVVIRKNWKLHLLVVWCRLQLEVVVEVQFCKRIVHVIIIVTWTVSNGISIDVVCSMLLPVLVHYRIVSTRIHHSVG